METSPPPRPAVDPFPFLYHQLVYTLTSLLPPPLDGSPEALRARNQAAVAKVAALLPVGANELDLAAQCIAARAQAEEMLRLVRQHKDDVGLVLRLNAQYGSTVRTSLAAHGRLMRVQALRQKREAVEGAATADAWTADVAEQSMLHVVERRAKPPEAARPGVAPAVGVEERIEENVSENGTNSHGVAFETRMSAHPGSQGARGSDETAVNEAMAGLVLARVRLAGRDLPANGHDGRGRADPGGNGNHETVSAGRGYCPASP